MIPGFKYLYLGGVVNIHVSKMKWRGGVEIGGG